MNRLLCRWFGHQPGVTTVPDDIVERGGVKYAVGCHVEMRCVRCGESSL